MKISHIIAESISQSINTEKKIGRIVSAIVNQNPEEAQRIGIHNIYKIAALLVSKNQVEDEHDLINQVKDKLGLDIDEDYSSTQLNRLSKASGRSLNKSLGRLQTQLSIAGGRFGKNRLAKLNNPLAENGEEE
jgi:hypothetical protein